MLEREVFVCGKYYFLFKAPFFFVFLVLQSRYFIISFNHTKTRMIMPPRAYKRVIDGENQKNRIRRNELANPVRNP